MSLTHPTIANAISLARRIKSRLEVGFYEGFATQEMSDVEDLLNILHSIQNHEAQVAAVAKRQGGRKA